MAVNDVTREGLARQVIQMLGLQAKYFRTRSHADLLESKDAERRLKALCVEIIHPPQAGLFEGETCSENP